MKDKLKTWLEKSGYPLELYVHKIAAENGYLCEKSQIYSDVETGTAREIDLVAYKHGKITDEYIFELNLIIECKKSEKPLIILSDGKREERYKQLLGHEAFTERFVDCGMSYFHLHDLDEKEKHIGSFSETVLAGYSIVPGFGKSDENLFKGIMGISKAHEHFRSTYHESRAREMKNEESKEGEWLRLQLPVVVVDAPLFTAYLGNDGELEIEEISWGSLLIRKPWAMNRGDSDSLCNIQVVCKNYFSNFISEVETFHGYISKSEKVFYQG
mgnify:CR=1 FL=1|tara:strand:- start:2115 stop:2927 length:813 start_codon:yes stop_codon:yes gene_type:complete